MWPRSGRRQTVRGLVLLLLALIVASCGGAAATPTATSTVALPTATAIRAAAAPTPSDPTGATPPAPSATAPLAPTATLAPTSPTAGQTTALLPCAAASRISQLQPPAPATARTTTAAPASPTATRPAAPTPTPRPAPQTDRVGFPEGYQDTFKLLFVFDRPDNKQVRVICGNDIAATVKPGAPFPYGSILVMETYRAKQDAAGNVVKDANGRYIREALAGIFVQRKEPGFGVEYGVDRSGEWEYVGFRPDKSYSNPPQNTNACATCHLNQAGQNLDFVFRMDLFFEGDKALIPPMLGENEANIFGYAFLPETLSIRVGDSVKWVNNDEAEHTVVANDNSFKSETLKARPVKPGDSFSHTFTQTGTFEYFCSLHPNMKGKVEVGR